MPSTNPVATPVNNVVNALKCGNAIVLAPSPKGMEACARLLGYIQAELDKVGLPRDLVQMLPPPASKAKSQRLMEAADLVIVTGSQANVRAAYRSGTPRHEGRRLRETIAEVRALGGDRLVQLNHPRGETPGYAVFDLSGSYTLPAGLSVQAGVENVFDELYADHLNRANPFDPDQVRVNEAGRTLWVKLRWRNGGR